MSAHLLDRQTTPSTHPAGRRQSAHSGIQSLFPKEEEEEEEELQEEKEEKKEEEGKEAEKEEKEEGEEEKVLPLLKVGAEVKSHKLTEPQRLP